MVSSCKRAFPSPIIPKKILKSAQIKNTFTFILILWIAGIFFSRFLQSVAIISAAAVFLLSDNWKESLAAYFRSPIAISFFGIFFVYLVSYFNSSNQPEFWNIFKNKLPYLFIPLSLLCVQQLEKQQLKLIQYFYIICCVASSAWSYVQYLQNPELYTQLYAQGEVIPTLIHHVSLAILLCIAVLFVLNNIVNESTLIEKIICFILLLWFVYFIHILSVRTGIVLLYISVFLFVFISLLSNKKPVFAIGLLLLIFLSAYLSYQKIPTIKSKIAYTWYGLSQYKKQQDTTNQVSDSRRILSDKIGWQLIQKNKLFGVGIGDIQDEMNSIYKQQYPQFKPDVYSHIHNQYLYTICGTGLILGILFCICLLIPFVQFTLDKKPIFALIYLMLLLVMIWEPFIENQLGNSIFLVMVCVGLLTPKSTTANISLHSKP